MSERQNAVVLAGGGVAGIAWETGVLLGLRDAAPDVMAEVLTPRTLLVGTSAGSTVAAQIAGGTDLEALFAAQVAAETAELAVDLDMVAFGERMAAAMAGATSPEDGRRRLGALALGAETVSPEVRRAVIDARLPVKEWSEWPLRIVAVDADTGAARVFDRDSGVDLVDAVAASCAVPGVWPTVEIEGARYMDGGMRSSANADLAAGSDRVLVVVPARATGPFGDAVPDAQLDALGGASVITVFTDSASDEAIGPNPLDPSRRRLAALAGRQVGRDAAERLLTAWGSRPRG
jgi:NTE family protein